VKISIIGTHRRTIHRRRVIEMTPLEERQSQVFLTFQESPLILHLREEEVG